MLEQSKGLVQNRVVMTDESFRYGERVRWIGTEYVGNVIDITDGKVRVVFDQSIYDIPVSKIERVSSRYPTWKQLDDLRAKPKGTVCVRLDGLREAIEAELDRTIYASDRKISDVVIDLLQSLAVQ